MHTFSKKGYKWYGLGRKCRPPCILRRRAECNRSRQSRRTGAATTGIRDAATSKGVDNAAAPLREKGVDIAVAPLRDQKVERNPVLRGEDRKILLDAATHGVTGTYD